MNWRILIKTALTALLLLLLAYQLDLTQLAKVFSSAQLLFLIPAVAVQLVSLLLSVFRWRTILERFNIQIRFVALLKIAFIGSFFNLILPSAIGGDFFRAYYLSRKKGRGMSTTLTTTILERSGGLCALLAIGTAAALYQRVEVEGVSLTPVFLLLISAYIVASLMLFNRRIHAFLARSLKRFHLQNVDDKMELISQGLHALSRSVKSIAIVLLLSLIVQFFSVLVVWIAAQALQIDAPFRVFLIFIPLINLSIMVPLTINGIGLREALYFLLFTQIGLEQEKAVALSLLNTVVVMAAALPGGIVYALYKKEANFSILTHPSKKEASERRSGL